MTAPWDSPAGRAHTVRWTWKQLEATLALVHEVAPEKRPAFNAKLRHLQRCGILAGSNRGRGIAVLYTPAQVVGAGFALELLQLGLTPEHAAGILTHHEAEILSDVALAARERSSVVSKGRARRFFTLDPRGLAYLQTGVASDASEIILDRAHRGHGGLRNTRFITLAVDEIVRSISEAAAFVGVCSPPEFLSELASRSGRLTVEA